MLLLDGRTVLVAHSIDNAVMQRSFHSHVLPVQLHIGAETDALIRRCCALTPAIVPASPAPKSISTPRRMPARQKRRRPAVHRQTLR
ncbi:hypothetical protein SS05631_d64720 (plasmid) [Sinorhizobium sp. CCBAU 05631]|nr:hypothetical protein SS05631_d64720 [Sinorhizobium sp. CCBAU 05631]